MENHSNIWSVALPTHLPAYFWVVGGNQRTPMNPSQISKTPERQYQELRIRHEVGRSEFSPSNLSADSVFEVNLYITSLGYGNVDILFLFSVWCQGCFV